MSEKIVSNSIFKLGSLAVALPLLLVGCVSVEEEPASQPTQTVTQEAEPEAETTEADAPEPVDLVVPDVVGMNTYDAELDLEALGFTQINSQDATSEERLVLLSSNWYVCESIPAAGTELRSDRTLVLLSVKNSESCPGGGAASGSSDSAPSSVNDTYGLGESWTDGDYIVTLNSVRTTTAGLTDPELSYFLVFDLSIENLTNEEQTISSLLSFELVGSDGYGYDLDIFADIKGSLDGSIRPGRVMRGEIAFDVEPQDFYELEVTPNLFGESAYFEVTAAEIG